MLNTLIVLLGPTGIGKTDLSISIARQLETSIISCDSRQFYREMSIGTASPEPEQLSAVEHHFIKHISVQEYYSASRFGDDVSELLKVLFLKQPYAIMTGGSGLYIDAVCGNMDEIPDTDPEVRKKYLLKFEKEGIESIRSDLRFLDPEHYKQIDLRNPKRILRALEICESTGRPYSSFLGKKKSPKEFRVLKIGLQMKRDILYKRIDERVDLMIDCGLEDEARGLLKHRNLNALNTVGYKEFFDFFDQNISRNKAIELIKRNSRRYAKRQITWWTRDKEINWFEAGAGDEIIAFINKNLFSDPANS